MIEHANDNHEKKAAVLFSVQTQGVSDEENDSSLLELRRLVKTLGLKVVATLTQRRPKPETGTLLGAGKLKELAGYTGGTKDYPTYQEVCSGKTGHAEAVEIVYNPQKTSFEKLAKLFLEIHDPTQVNRQGPDIGSQYRSEIFYFTGEEKKTAEKLLKILKDKGLKIATKIEAAARFWPAENYHQDYYKNKGKAPYCHAYKKRF